MNKTPKNQKGFTTVEGLLITLILVVIGGVGYMVYHNDHKTKAASLSTTAAKTTTSSSTKSISSSTQYLSISQWNVKLQLTSDIHGISYSMGSISNSVNGDMQDAMINVPDSKCNPMANIYRGSANDIDPATVGFNGGGSTFQANNDKQIDGYYYSLIQANGSSCFSGEQTIAGTADGAQTEAVYSQLKAAFDSMSTTSSN